MTDFFNNTKNKSLNLRRDFLDVRTDNADNLSLDNNVFNKSCWLHTVSKSWWEASRVFECDLERPKNHPPTRQKSRSAGIFCLWAQYTHRAMWAKTEMQEFLAYSLWNIVLFNILMSILQLLYIQYLKISASSIWVSFFIKNHIWLNFSIVNSKKDYLQ